MVEKKLETNEKWVFGGKEKKRGRKKADEKKTCRSHNFLFSPK